MEKSESITELAKALNKAQGQLRPAKKEAVNPFFKSRYADLASIYEVCRQPLFDNGLAVIQLTHSTIENGLVLETVLMHTSGEWLSGELAVNPLKNEPQAIGSALTYARRYALSAILGIATDEDDDAESAMARDTKKQPEKIDKPLLTEAQRKKIIMAAKEKGLLVKKDGKDEWTQEFKAHVASYGRAHLKDLLKSEASQLIEDIEGDKIKKLDESPLVEEAKKLGAEIIPKQASLVSDETQS